MIKRLSKLGIVAVMLLMAVVASAQNLQSQRGESQSLGELLGEKVDHKGLVINPTPQHLVRHDSALDLTAGVALKGRAAEFDADIDFLGRHPLAAPLRVEYGKKYAKRHSLEAKSGAYYLEISKRGVAIEAYDELGVFYAIETLRQIVQSPISYTGAVPHLEIRDWPDLKYRGVVEGFYGTPWSHTVRLSLIDYYGRNKMNYYIYGPKDDPYHSSPYWREPYPADEARNIHELVEACRRNRVHFVWAIHPGQDIKWNEEDYNNLVRKFEAMYDLGVRAFAIHFDDISGEGTNPLKQTALMNRLNAEFVKVKGDVEPMIVCPTDYTHLWANPTERGSLVRYGQTLDADVDVFWTGDAVCSDLTERTMEWVNSRIQRPALFWWNFPVTDYARHIIMQGPAYGLARTMNEDKVRGIVSNPMEHGEASKIALYSTADYAWNTEDYNPVDSWERALADLAPEVKEAYRLFAIHSCDTETGYRRLESWQTETFTMEEYTPEKAALLLEELRRIEALPTELEAMQNRALLEELRPWIVELAKLGTRCRKAIECYELYLMGEKEAFWTAYVDNLMSEEQVAMYDAHRIGTMKLQPFYERMMDGMASAFYEGLTGEKSSTLSPAGSYRSLQAPQAKYMYDDDPETYYHSGQGQRTDDFVAADMGIVREVREVRIIQGRNSVDDVDYFDHCIVEYSADGKNWTALTEPLQGVYDIEWKGEPFEARYVGIRKLESKKTNWLAIREFAINPVTEAEYGVDSNPYTVLRGDYLEVALSADTKGVTLLLDRVSADAGYTLYCGDVVVKEGAIHSSYHHIDIESPADRVVISGADGLFEAIF